MHYSNPLAQKIKDIFEKLHVMLVIYIFMICLKNFSKTFLGINEPVEMVFFFL